MKHVFFSIVIPTYNRAGLLPKALLSLQAQHFPDFEVIVVDDGSTDHTETVMARLADEQVRYYRIENSERGAARNFGVDRARGRYITFLDSDDVFYPQCLRNAYESIGRYQNPPLLHLGYEVTDEHLRPKVKIDNLPSDDIRVLVKGNPLSCMGVFMRADVARQYRFTEDRDLAGSEDWELWLRAAANVGLKTDNRISAALIDHSARSVRHYDQQKLQRRKQLALQYAFADAAVQAEFGRYLSQINAYWNSYIALHLVLGRQHRAGLRFWLRSVWHYPPSAFERRTLAIAKHMLLDLLRPGGTEPRAAEPAEPAVPVNAGR